MITEIPADLSDTALWAIVIGFFQPVALNLILQSKWSGRAQALVGFGFSVVVGTITAALSGSFDGVGVVTATLLVLVVSISTYRGFWKQVTPNLKSATSGGKNELAENIAVAPADQ